jgi:hypothetical protein
VKKKLQLEKVGWKVELLSSLSLAHQKLDDYYHISNWQRGKPYHWAMILDPTMKLQLYQKLHPSHLFHYKNNFLQEYQRSYARFKALSSSPSTSTSARSTDKVTSFLDIACAEQQQLLALLPGDSQVHNYLDSTITPVSAAKNVLTFWQMVERSQPGLAQLMNDVLSAPLSSVGIEREFSTAQISCIFQRYHLDANTTTVLLMAKDYEGHAGKVIREKFDANTKEGEAISFDDVDLKVAQAQYMSDDEEGEED